MPKPDDDTLAENNAAIEQQNTDLMQVTDKIPDFIEKGNLEGSADIAVEDARVPRLVLAQPQSHQVLDGDPLYIDGLTPGMSFNDLTGQIYGKGPIDVIVVKADPPRWVEFDDDRRVIDPEVKYGDPRTEFTTNDNGESVPPVATKFYDYVVLKCPELDPMAWSCKSTAIKWTSMPLRGMIKNKPVPIYACIYRLTPKPMKNDFGTWYIYIPSPRGMIMNETTYNKAKAMFNVFKDKKVEYEQTAPVEKVEPTTTEI